MSDKKTIIVGANGQLGRALQIEFPEADCVDRDTLDISLPNASSLHDWSQYDTILNAAAYTAVDQAETPEGRRDAWLSNATAVGNLAAIAIEHNATLVHISSDYVFDGAREVHDETEPFSPLSVYGASKAAGDIAASAPPKHYVIRTSWVIGDGNNFVRTMKSLADRGIEPSVVNDQIGRLTFTPTLAAGIKHLLDSSAPHGTYNLTNDGTPASWADIAKIVYNYAGKPEDIVTPVSTALYYEGKENIAPRPLRSTLDLTKIQATGFAPQDWQKALDEYMKGL